MIIKFEIARNKNREPYQIRTWKSKKLESEKPAKILAYYNVEVLNTGKVSVFDITEPENGKSELLDHDDTLFDNLNELNLEKYQIEELIGNIIDKVQEMYFRKTDNEKLKFEI